MNPTAPLPSATPEAYPPFRAHVAPRFDAWLRGIMIVGGIGLISLLVVARVLEPSARGMGTHRQLGLPPCSFVTMFGMRCPACGMTTSWSHLTRGNVVGALGANSGGTLLGLAALVSGPWLLASGLRGRWVGRPPHEWVVVAICGVLVAVIIADWSLRLWLG